MDDSQFKSSAKRLLAVNELVSKLDPSIRLAAFEILAGYVQKQDSESESSDHTRQVAKKKTSSSASKFFSEHEHEKESDNVLLVVAWLYSQHGVFDIAVSDVRAMADGNGLTIPNRVDMTLRQFKNKTKPMFKKTAGGWKLTPAGEKHLKATYSVRKGTTPRAEEAE